MVVSSFFKRGRKCKPIFVQIARQVVKLNASDLRLPSRAWKVKLVGEGADDAGGVFDDTITEMCQVGKVCQFEMPGRVLLFCLILFVFVNCPLCSIANSSCSSVLSHSNRTVYLGMPLRKKKKPIDCSKEMEKSHTTT